jgi:hypothetical protein
MDALKPNSGSLVDSINPERKQEDLIKPSVENEEPRELSYQSDKDAQPDYSSDWA